jgi:hypothetical protein
VVYRSTAAGLVLNGHNPGRGPEPRGGGTAFIVLDRFPRAEARVRTKVSTVEAAPLFASGLAKRIVVPLVRLPFGARREQQRRQRRSGVEQGAELQLHSTPPSVVGRGIGEVGRRGIGHGFAFHVRRAVGRDHPVPETD